MNCNLVCKVVCIINMLAFVSVTKAQVVSGTNVIDCSNMPSSMVEQNIGPYKYATGQLQRHLGNKGISGGPSLNDKVSKKFEVASANLVGVYDWASAMGFDSGVNTNQNSNPASFLDTGCKTLGDGWRLPNQKEMLIILILRNKLAYTLTNNEYWTSTEYFNDKIAGNADYSRAFYVSFGYSADNNKSVKLSIRCIKDLP